MSQEKPPSDKPHKDIAAVQRMGREEIFNVFRAEGGNEFSGEHPKKIPDIEIESRSGPSISHSMEDATIKRDSQALIDASGPSQQREMSDSTGPSQQRELSDSTGPVVARRLDGSYGVPVQRSLPGVEPRQPQDKPASKRPPSVTSAASAIDDSTHSLPQTVHVQTFAIHMEDRLAQMKASQKETLEKMRQLEQEGHELDDSDHDNHSIHNETHPIAATPHPSSDNEPAVIAGSPTRRAILDEFLIHPAIRQTTALHHRDIVDEVIAAIIQHRVVVIGMAGNPFVSRARRLLKSKSIDCHYLEYGGYFSQWRRRNALKMWTGWPTFPMIFIDRVLIGGFEDLKALSTSDELTKLLGTEDTNKDE